MVPKRQESFRNPYRTLNPRQKALSISAPNRLRWLSVLLPVILLSACWPGWRGDGSRNPLDAPHDGMPRQDGRPGEAGTPYSDLSDEPSNPDILIDPHLGPSEAPDGLGVSNEYPRPEDLGLDIGRPANPDSDSYPYPGPSSDFDSSSDSNPDTNPNHYIYPNRHSYPEPDAWGAQSEAAEKAAREALRSRRYLPSISVNPFTGPIANAPASADVTAPDPGSNVEPGAAPEAGNVQCAGIARPNGGGLMVDGRPFTFFGINARYLLDHDFPEKRVESTLAELSNRGVNTVRVWYFQDEDADRLERLLDAGNRHGIRFVISMADNVHHGVDWFFGPDDEEHVRPHIERTVARFKDRPEILLWEPINEPNCGDGRYDDACLETLRAWLGMMAKRIKAIDACHVVSTSMISAGNFENEAKSYRKLHRKDAIEIFSAHRRSNEDRDREVEMADDADRPIFYGEVYDVAYDEGCQALDGKSSPNSRAKRVARDLERSLEEGVDGYLLWDLALSPIEGEGGQRRYLCSKFGFDLDDPLWGVLRERGLPAEVPW